MAMLFEAVLLVRGLQVSDWVKLSAMGMVEVMQLAMGMVEVMKLAMGMVEVMKLAMGTDSCCYSFAQSQMVAMEEYIWTE